MDEPSSGADPAHRLTVGRPPRGRPPCPPRTPRRRPAVHFAAPRRAPPPRPRWSHLALAVVRLPRHAPRTARGVRAGERAAGPYRRGRGGVDHGAGSGSRGGGFLWPFRHAAGVTHFVPPV